MSQWLTILFHSLLNQFWFQLHNPELVEKLGCYTSFPTNFRVLDYVSRLHQADLSKSCKHWDIFLSHCSCLFFSLLLVLLWRLRWSKSSWFFLDTSAFQSDPDNIWLGLKWWTIESDFNFSLFYPVSCKIWLIWAIFFILNICAFSIFCKSWGSSSNLIFAFKEGLLVFSILSLVSSQLHQNPHLSYCFGKSLTETIYLIMNHLMALCLYFLVFCWNQILVFLHV